jgi:phage tail sheath gpL-like
MVLMLQYDDSKTEIVPYQLYDLTHYKDTGDQFGFNSQMYVVHRAVWLQTGGLLPVIAMPIPAPAGGAAASGTPFTITGTATAAGNAVFYVHGERFSVAVPKDMTETQLGDAIVSAINGSSDVLTENGVNTAGVVTADCTYLGTTGDEIRVTGPKKDEDQTPAGLTIAYGAFTGGAGDETPLQAAYDAFIIDQRWKTEIITPSNSTAALDLALTNIGLPEDGTNKGSGLWSDDDYRPCTNWTANIESTYSGAIAPAAGREADPDNVIVTAPDRREMPFVIAAVEAARAALRWSDNPSVVARGLTLIIDEAVDADNDWTLGADGNTNVNNAVKAGVTPIRTASNGTSITWDVTTTYRPVTPAYPSWQFECNKRKSWNIGKSLKDDKVLNSDGVIVNSAAEATLQDEAVDASTYEARVTSLAIIWQQRGFIFLASFTIANMVVTLNDQANPDRVGRYIPVILSGNARVVSDTVYVDRNIAIADLTDIALNVG